ncbi:MAG: HAMP domain-containing histidine kinase [Deltaproteobacteria bacterium]|nr:HAMP domain-containing histidine kinase [Deltaproteobacteria bacterium]
MDNKRSDEIEFFGKITAGITHELKNVLAVIKETSGLMGDLMDLTDTKSFQHKERFQKSLSTIQKQIENGVTLLTHLNKFAHATDKEKAEIDLHETVQEMTVLCGRYARLKNITLKAHPTDTIMTFPTCQVSLQMILFSCIEYCISGLPQQNQIDISILQKDKGDYEIKFDCSDELADSGDISAEKSHPNLLDKLKKTAALVQGEVFIEPSAVSLRLSSYA